MSSISAPTANDTGQRWPIGVLVALFATYVIWGTTYLAIRFALPSIPPFMLVGTRFLTAGSLMFVYFKWRGAPWPTAREWRDSALVAVLMIGTGMCLTTWAEQFVGSALTAALIATVPLWTALISTRFGRAISRRDWTGIAIGFVGIILINFEGDLRTSPLGALALIIAPLSWSVGSVLSQQTLRMPAGPIGTACEMLCGGALAMTFSLLLGEQARPITLSAGLAWAYLVTFGSILAFSAYMYLLSKVRPALATSYAYVNPVVALGAGLFIGNEQIATWGFLGIGVILAGVIILMTGRDRS